MLMYEFRQTSSLKMKGKNMDILEIENLTISLGHNLSAYRSRVGVKERTYSFVKAFKLNYRLWIQMML